MPPGAALCPKQTVTTDTTRAFATGICRVPCHVLDVSNAQNYLGRSGPQPRERALGAGAGEWLVRTGTPLRALVEQADSRPRQTWFYTSAPLVSAARPRSIHLILSASIFSPVKWGQKPPQSRRAVVRLKRSERKVLTKHSSQPREEVSGHWQSLSLLLLFYY